MYDIKKILIYIFSFGVFLLQLSCDDDGYNPDDISIKGAKTQVDIDPNNSFFNFFDTENTKVAFDLSIPAGDQNVTDIKLMLHYIDVETGEVSDSVEFQTVATFPSTVTITLKEAVDLIPGLSMDKIKPGDTFDFSMAINTKSGQILTRVSPRLQQNQTKNPYDFSPSFPVGCPSNIPEGVYSGETTGLVNTTKDVTVTNMGGGIYATSDMSAGALGALIGDPSYEGRVSGYLYHYSGAFL
ncbi:hypothetical protein [Flexithrix dorotheae]|uniref:hypothetical protein n=1 Tax=Flexithrix dorotheae TaxID=70993 RepID=UPI00037A9929|nr:hypothetical protein [Flexithrix dorotheae]